MHAEDIRAGSPTPTSPAPRRWQGERSSRCPTSSGCSCSCRRTTSPRSAPSRWRKQGGSLDSVRRAPGRLPPACAPSQSRGSSSSRGRNADLEAHIRPHLLRRDIQVPHQERQSACARLPQHRRAAGGRLRLGGRHGRDPPCLPQRHTLGRQARSDLQALRDLARSRRRRPPSRDCAALPSSGYGRTSPTTRWPSSTTTTTQVASRTRSSSEACSPPSASRSQTTPRRRHAETGSTRWKATRRGALPVDSGNNKASRRRL